MRFATHHETAPTSRRSMSHCSRPILDKASAYGPVIRGLVLTALLCIGPSCRRENDSASEDPRPADARQQSVDLVVFPDELLVEDASVNDFVTSAMAVCAGGDYERFRLLWSPRHDPLPRSEYEQGWQAVRQIRIRALEKVILAPDPRQGRTQAETVYAVLADVSLDPTHAAGQKEPKREVVLMLTREHDAWRLASAPKQMRVWIRDRARTGEGVNAEPFGRP